MSSRRASTKPSVLLAEERTQELHGLQVGLDRPGRLPLGPEVTLEGATEVVYAWLRHAIRIA
jgi:hypothetical protein